MSKLQKRKAGVYQSSFVNGIAKHYFIICDQCRHSSGLYTLPKSKPSADCDNKIMFGHNLLQILGGRIAGIGKSGLDTINSMIGLPSTLANRAFYAAQKKLSNVSMEMAVRSCNRAAQKLRDLHGKSGEELLNVSVSYDGAYQKRSGKGGGGFARYCFAPAISIETVLSFEVACNGCRYCIEKQEALRDKRLSRENYCLWLVEHEKTCQAKEYDNVKSVALESKLAPVVFRKSIDQKLLYSTVVADGDDKSVNLFIEMDIYGEFGMVISRKECLSHVQKRLRMHLFEKQKDYIFSNKIYMANKLSKANKEKDKKVIRQSYKPIMFRDSKLIRNKWDGSDDLEICSEIELMSDAMIDTIVSLYGFTIKTNSHRSLSEIRNLLLSIVYHLSATDENCSEMHQYCPVGQGSWCHYQKAKFLGDPIPSHPRALSQRCKDRILGIIGPYISLEFLDKVKGGKTSNLNEALHHLIWSTVSKTTAIDLDLMHFGASLAVIRYNDGFSGILELVEMLGLVPGHTLIRHCNVVDKDRLYHSEYQIDTIYPKRRYSIKKPRR